MARGNGQPTAAEKGKGKAVEDDASAKDKKPDEQKKDKNGKLVDGKKDGEHGLPEGMEY